ncbi:hypothetical protein GTO27_13335, partial [Candidatus Bathyarchaeota archaeon]|nr:hypothetical protein [Candidatus Bathyarchaeota archaeon]
MKYKPSPEAIGHVQDVKIMVDATTFISNCKIKVVINGEERVKDQSLVVATTTLGFGQNLVFKGKVDEGIIVYAKSDGTDTMKILGTITGIEIPKKENENSNESLA